MPGSTVLDYVLWSQREAVSVREADILAQVQTFEFGIGTRFLSVRFLYVRFL